MGRVRHPFFLILLLLAIVPVLVYLPGLGGSFLFDDYPNIVDNNRLRLDNYTLGELLRASLSSDSGLLRRPITMLSFALNLDVCGLTPSCFKIVNLAIHILCGLLLFLITLRLLRRSAFLEQRTPNGTVMVMAALVALLWLLHPINLTNVVYVVQRMNSLSALFVFAGMWLYFSGRQRLEDRKGGRLQILSAFALTVPAMLAKENGALLPLFLLLIEAYFYQFRAPAASDTRLIRGLFLMAVALPAIAAMIFLVSNPDWLQQRYAGRDFTLGERLLTQSRVLWFYISLILLPANQRLSLFHDQFVVSQGILDPVTTLISVLGLVAVLAVILLTGRRARLLSFGLAFFLAGHLMESTVIPLEMIFEHRNYVPSAGLLIPLVYYLYSAGISIQTSRVSRAGLVALLILLATVTHMRAIQWGNPLLLAELEAQTNPDSARVNNYAGLIYSQAYMHLPEADRDPVYQAAHDYYIRAYELDKKNLTALVSLIMLESRAHGTANYYWHEAMINALHNKKITASDTRAVGNLLECQRRQSCPGGRNEFKQIINAVERNPHRHRKFLALLYTHFSQHFWYMFNDGNNAMHYSRMAYEIFPGEVTLQLNYARILSAMGENHKAENILRQIEAGDRLGIHNARIGRIRTTMKSKHNG